MKNSFQISLLALALQVVVFCPGFSQWQSLSTGGMGNYISVAMMNGDYVAIASAAGGYGETVVSQDGGLNWDLQLQTFQEFNSICFAGDSTFIAAGPNSMVKSTNGGMSWNPVFQSWPYIESVFFLDPQRGFTAHFNTPTQNLGGISTTLDGGLSWDTIPDTATSDAFYDLWFFNDSVGVVVGTENCWFPTGGMAGRTTNGGQTWSKTYFSWNAFMNDVFFVDANVGYACGGTRVIKTTDGGITWSQTNNDTLQGFNGVAFLDANHGYAVGDNGFIGKTTDGGNSWTQDSSGTSQRLLGIAVHSDGTYYCVGDSGTVLKLNAPLARAEEINPAVKVIVFPNPSNGMISIQGILEKPSDGMLSLKVITLEGRTIQEKELQLTGSQFESNLNLENLSAGFYMLQILGEGINESIRLSIE